MSVMEDLKDYVASIGYEPPKVEAYVDDLLEAEELAAFEEAMREDAALRREVELSAALVRGLQEHAEYELPRDFVAVAHLRCMRENLEATESRDSRRGWVYGGGAFAAACAAFLLAVGLPSGPTIDQPTAPMAAVTPEPSVEAPADSSALASAELLSGELVRETEGNAQALGVGDVVRSGDRVRNTGSGNATVRLSDAHSVVLAAQSSIDVLELTPHRSTIALRAGRVDAEVQGVSDKEAASLVVHLLGQVRALRITEGKARVVKTQEQAFVASMGAKVAVMEGKEQTMAIAAGEALAMAGTEVPKPMSQKPMTLAADWKKDAKGRLAKRDAQGERWVTLSGRVLPGTRVWVDENPVEVGAYGTFEARIKLDKDRSINTVELRAEGLFGGEKQLAMALPSLRQGTKRVPAATAVVPEPTKDTAEPVKDPTQDPALGGEWSWQ